VLETGAIADPTEPPAVFREQTCVAIVVAAIPQGRIEST